MPDLPAQPRASTRRSAEQPRRPGMLSRVPDVERLALTAALREDIAALGLALDDAAIVQLMAYLDHLLHWNALINLSAVTAPAEMLSVHIVDSLAALPVLHAYGNTSSPNFRILDVGTGPGLPAIPWAIALADRKSDAAGEPNARIHAVDAVRKKVDTIVDFIAKEKLRNLTAAHARIETLRQPFDVVTSRAFSSLANFVALAGASVKPGGTMLALKGKRPDEEIAALAGSGWRATTVVPLVVPRLPAERCVVVLRRG